MLNFTAALISGAGRKVKKVRNILQNRHAISLMSIFATSVVIFLLMGAFYSRNEIIITDDGHTYSILTMQNEPENILAEQGISLTGLDYFNYNTFEGEAVTLSITRSFDVTITADGEVYKTEAYPGETVSQILKRAEVEIGKHDSVSPEYNRSMSGSSIKIARAYAVYARIDGELHEFYTLPASGDSIAAILSREGFEPGEEDVVSDNFYSMTSPGMTAEVSTIRYTERTDIKPIPFETVTQYSDSAALGTIIVKTEGTEGVEQVIVREKLVEGVVISEEVISTRIINLPETQILLEGRALKTPISPREFPEIELVNGRPANYERLLTGKATAYTAPPTSGTASGRPLVVGTVAVDPRIIPYGSLLYIVTTDGSIVYGAAIAADTGSFIYESEDTILVDVFMGLTSENLQKARDWGARQVDVYVINTGKY